MWYLPVITVPRWGSGAGRNDFAIVDSITGRVYDGFGIVELPTTRLQKTGDCEPLRMEFHRESRLLKISECLNEENCGYYDYLMRDGIGLELIRKEFDSPAIPTVIVPRNVSRQRGGHFLVNQISRLRQWFFRFEVTDAWGFTTPTKLELNTRTLVACHVACPPTLSGVGQYGPADGSWKHHNSGSDLRLRTHL